MPLSASFQVSLACRGGDPPVYIVSLRPVTLAVDIARGRSSSAAEFPLPQGAA